MRSFRIAQIVSLLAVFFAASTAHAVTVESVLHSFPDPATLNDGSNPKAGLIQASDGFLYGTTNAGGASGNGAIFKIAADGTGYLIIHSFAGGLADGSSPKAGLVQASDGNLYGTTSAGGANGKGVLYEIGTNGGGYQVLHSFGAGLDGQTPVARPIQASDGNLYGTTSLGGANSAGAIYKFAVGGAGYQTVFSFGAVSTDAAQPFSGLYQGPDGFFYGTSLAGGTSALGTVYKILPNGAGYNTLHSFAGGATDGSSPTAGLIEATDGLLYGDTQFGGPSNMGALFDIAPNGANYSAFRLLSGADGASPLGGFTLANNGKLYGATQGNGTNIDGSIFSIAQGGGSFTLVYNFGTILNDGTDPLDSPVLAIDGKFYGTTVGGGANGHGTVFKLTQGLAAAPTGLAAVAGDTQVMLTWNSYPGAATYNVYRGTSSGGESGTAVATGLASPSFLDTGLTNGTTYFYQVTAVVASVETAKSSEASAQPQAAASLHLYSAGLQMISTPADYTGFGLWQCFDAGPITLAAWSNTQQYAISPAAPANVLVPGVGYWVRFAAPAHLLDIGVDVIGNQAIQVPLVQGWNLIGNPDPFGQSGSLLQVKTGSTTQSFANANKAGIIGPTFYTFQSGDVGYEVLPASSATLQPFLGYWLFAFQPCTLIFPAGS